MTRLASIGPRSVHQPLTLSIYDQLETSTDWDYVPGADITSVTTGNTITITSRHHKVTISGGTIDNISDGSGASAGQLLELYCVNANTFRNQGGGSGNIRSASGNDIAVAAGDVLELVYDGTNWRQCSTSTLNVGTLSTSGGNSQGAGMAAGVIVGSNGQLWIANTAANTALAVTVPGDTTVSRFLIDTNGMMGWGTGAAARDVTIARSAVGVLTLTGSLIVSASCQQAKSYEAYVTTTGGVATWTPTVGGGLVQRYNMNATGTLTIASPGAPPANFSGLLVLVVKNASGGSIVLSWNAAFFSSFAAPSNGSAVCGLFAYNPANSKWVMVASVAAE